MSSENSTDRAVHKGYYRSKIEIKYYNATINWQNIPDQPVKINMNISDNIRKIETG